MCLHIGKKNQNRDLTVVPIPMQNIWVSLLVYSFPSRNLNNEEIWCAGLWSSAWGNCFFFFLLTLLYFRVFKQGRIEDLKTVRKYKIRTLLAELGSYFRVSRWRSSDRESDWEFPIRSSDREFYISGGSKLRLVPDYSPLGLAETPITRTDPGSVRAMGVGLGTA